MLSGGLRSALAPRMRGTDFSPSRGATDGLKSVPRMSVPRATLDTFSPSGGWLKLLVEIGFAMC